MKKWLSNPVNFGTIQLGFYFLNIQLVDVVHSIASIYCNHSQGKEQT